MSGDIGLPARCSLRQDEIDREVVRDRLAVGRTPDGGWVNQVRGTMMAAARRIVTTASATR